MTAVPFSSLPAIAEQLHDEEIHVWRLDYRRQEGRTPLRHVLAAYLGIDVSEVVLIDGAHGRPQLAPWLDQTLGFNWSHSGEHALIAVARGITPGIDLERLRQRTRALAISERFFSHDEHAMLAALPGEDLAVNFLELWTAKEAVTKATGRGLAFGLDRLSIGRSVDRLTLQRLDGDDASAWQLHRLIPESSLVAALAWRGAPRLIRLGALAGGA
ncbi:MAG TPA: 4'-phosphopantetheinyl transferase superfamily protein [Rhodanobacter sp.]|nr:4'-phosphopantetheinyl transferase superfamily protein [Rhodanobacter sp.]